MEEGFSVASDTRAFLVGETIDLVRIFRSAVYVSMIGISVIGMSIFCSVGTFGSCLCVALGYLSPLTETLLSISAE